MKESLCIEYCSTLEENGTRLCPDAMLRAWHIWQSRPAAAAIHTVRRNWDNIWEVSDINPDFNAFNKFGITWAKAIDGPGGAQMGYLKRFYEEHHFEEMVPYNPAEAGEYQPIYRISFRLPRSAGIKQEH